MGLLRDKMIRDMKLRGFSPRTQQSYLQAVVGLAKHYHQSPDRLTEEQVQAYLLYLMQDRRLSWSTCNVAISAFRFLYGNTLGMESMCLAIPPRKKVTKLPEVLSTQEVARLLKSADNPRDRVLLMTTYDAGLRVSEVVRLKVTDIDSQRMTIRVEHGKGNKDRYVTLSQRLLMELRLYWKMFRPKPWLFPSKDPQKHMTITTAQRAFYKAKEKAKITKAKGIHTLRHCFATHMLEAGYDPRTIQILMGHTAISTTMIYTQVTEKKITSLKSPLDLLESTDPNSFDRR